MRLILVSDVFGNTPALCSLKNKLEAEVIVEPYNGANFEFNDDTEAYSFFIKNVGLESYVSSLLNVLKSSTEPTILIGFSIGASAIWKLPVGTNNNIKMAYCFYGSQIRHATSISPAFNTHLVLPKSEPHFDVGKLKKELSNKHNVMTTQVEYLHGFMNYYSRNYNEIGYAQQVEFLQTRLSQFLLN